MTADDFSVPCPEELEQLTAILSIMDTQQTDAECAMSPQQHFVWSLISYAAYSMGFRPAEQFRSNRTLRAEVSNPKILALHQEMMSLDKDLIAKIVEDEGDAVWARFDDNWCLQFEFRDQRYPPHEMESAIRNFDSEHTLRAARMDAIRSRSREMNEATLDMAEHFLLCDISNRALVLAHYSPALAGQLGADIREECLEAKRELTKFALEEIEDQSIRAAETLAGIRTLRRSNPSADDADGVEEQLTTIWLCQIRSAAAARVVGEWL